MRLGLRGGLVHFCVHRAKPLRQACRRGRVSPRRRARRVSGPCRRRPRRSLVGSPKYAEKIVAKGYIFLACFDLSAAKIGYDDFLRLEERQKPARTSRLPTAGTVRHLRVRPLAVRSG